MLYTLTALIVALAIAGHVLDCRTLKDWLVVFGVTGPLWIGVVLLLLSACASTRAEPSIIHGDTSGGVINMRDWFGDVSAAHAAVKAHCAKYGKRPGPGYPVGGTVVFGCA